MDYIAWHGMAWHGMVLYGVVWCYNYCICSTIFVDHGILADTPRYERGIKQGTVHTYMAYLVQYLIKLSSIK